MNMHRVTAALLLGAIGASTLAHGQISVPQPNALPGASRLRASGVAVPEDYTIRIDSFQTLLWQPDDNYFRSPGPVRIELRSFQRGDRLLLTADDAEGRPDGDIVVRGGFRLVREDSVLTGRELTMNVATETGSLVGARAEIGNMRLTGGKLTFTNEGGLVASQASFTTCAHERPDYRIAAREIRLTENGTVTARGVSLFVGKTPVLAVPWMQRNFKRRVQSAFPLPGYSKETGIKLRVGSNIVSRPEAAMTYEIVASLHQSPFGNVTYERDLGRVSKETLPPNTRKVAMSDPLPSALEMHPTLESGYRDLWDEDHRLVAYAALGAKEAVGNRIRTDLRLSRYPEIGLSGFRSGVRRPSNSGAQQASRSVSGPAVADRWGYHWDLSAGWYRELPTDAQAGRLALRTGVASPSWTVLPRLELRAGLAMTGALYDRDRSYGVISPEAEARWNAARSVQLGIAYRQQRERGTTPFVVDRVDVRNEMRLYCQGGQPGWDFSLALAYDTDRMRAYDTNVVLRRKLDCMEVGVSYRSRSQGLGLILNLLP